MKPRIKLIVAMAVIFLFSTIAIAANYSGWSDTLSKWMGHKSENVSTNVVYQDILDTPAPKSRLPAKVLLTGAAMAGKRIVGVGLLGQIVYSDDNGKNWAQASVPVSSDLLAVHFPTPLKGWAVGHDGIVLHSEDGGATWQKQFDGRAAAQVLEGYYLSSSSCSNCHDAAITPSSGNPHQTESASLMEEIKRFTSQGPDKPFLDVWFENENTGYIVGAFSLIFRTVNGGKSWVPLYDRIDNPKRYHLYSIRPIAKDLFLTAEQGTVFKLDPKTGRFTAIKTSYSGSFFGITGKQGVVIAFGMRGNAFRSSDEGATWQKIETGVPSGLISGAVTDDGRIILVSQGGHVLVSNGDCSSFSPIQIDQPTPASGATLVDKTTIALVGPRGPKLQPIK